MINKERNREIIMNTINTTTKTIAGNDFDKRKLT